MSNYRADIDGLRAVAIVPVVLFHAGVPGFAGGYVGVDVFFVISGFLITQLLLADLAHGRFSIVAFYERRIRRIFPALFAMLAVVTVAAAWLLLPQDLVAYGRSVVATAFFFSNVEFWQSAGYFARAADEAPLLHTWSLAVEEQFYIVFPLFLWALHRRTRANLVAWTAAIAVASLALAAWTVPRDPDTAFYLPHTRAWELALGALLAMRAVPSAPHAWVRHVAGLVGLAMIGVAVAGYDATTPFPGIAALLPCVGTALIVWAGSGTHAHHATGDLLARRPLVRIGLVSYSLYLWHWPLLAFASYAALGAPTSLDRAIAVAVAVLAAIASWRWVERPFRGRSGLFERRGLFTAAGLAMTAMLAFGLAAFVGNGWPYRLSPQVRTLAAGRDDHAPLDAPCWNVPIEEVARGGLCRTGAPGPPPTFLVWGDSHARVLTEPIDQAARRAGRAGVLAARSGCAPLPGVRRADHGPRRRCDAFADAVLAYAVAEPAITDVVLIGRWGQLAEGRPYGHEAGAAVRLEDARTSSTGVAENRRVLEHSLATTAAALGTAGKRVWILGPVPEIGWDVPGTLARAMRFDRTVQIAPTRAEFETRQRHAFAILQRVAAGPAAALVPLHPWLCDARRCRVVGSDGAPLYFDDDHLSRAGARVVAPAVEPIFSTTTQYRAAEAQ